MSSIDDLLGIAALATLGWSAALLAPQLLPSQVDSTAAAPTAVLTVPVRNHRAENVQQTSLPDARHPG